MSENDNTEELADTRTPVMPTLYQRFLLIFVIIMGILLIAGFAIVATTIITRLNRDDTRQQLLAQDIPIKNMKLPESAKLTDMIAENNHLILRLQLPQSVQLWVLDIRSGEVLQKLNLR